MEQVATAYETAPDRVEAARGALESLRGIIVVPAFDALMAALAAAAAPPPEEPTLAAGAAAPPEEPTLVITE
jgi:hypothetical protein